MSDPMQRELLGALVGEVIGEGLLQTYSNRWLLGAILDSRRQATPRVMLSALGAAARAALESDPTAFAGRLLTEAALREGVRRAGIDRLRELRETHPVVRRLENVELRKVPVSAAVMDRWLAAPVEGEPAELVSPDGAAVRKHLLHLGLLSQPDASASCDLPDLFLYALRASRAVRAGRDAGRARPQPDRETLRSRGIEAAVRAILLAEEERKAAAGRGSLTLGPVIDALERGAALLEDSLRTLLEPREDVLSMLAQVYHTWAGFLLAAEARTKISHVLALLEPLASQVQFDGLVFFLGLLRDSLAYRADADAWGELAKAGEHYRAAIAVEGQYAPLAHLLLASNLVWRFACRPQELALFTEAERAWRGATHLIQAQHDTGLAALSRCVGAGVHQTAALWMGQDASLPLALELLQEATALTPYEEFSLVNQGNGLLLHALQEPLPERQGVVAQAEASFKRALELSFEEPNALAGLARVTLHRITWGLVPLSRLDELETQLLRLYDARPDCACTPLASLYGLRGDRERRDFYLKRCQQLAQMLPLSWMSLEPGLADIAAPT